MERGCGKDQRDELVREQELRVLAGMVAVEVYREALARGVPGFSF